MAKRLQELTQESVRHYFNYDPATGEFVRARSVQGAPAGVSGHVRADGYVRMRFAGAEHYVHRLAWLYMYGEWPAQMIDHADRNPSNNAIGNLRVASTAQNNQNVVKPRGQTSSGERGVSWFEPAGRWRARISIDGKEKTLGYFRSIEEARAAYIGAKRLHHSFASL